METRNAKVESRKGKVERGIAKRESRIANRSAGLEVSRFSIRDSEGFTLLEVLVALAIVGIAVTMVLQLFSGSLRAVSASEDYVKATLKAEAKMREILTIEEPAETSWTEATADGYRVDVVVRNVLTERTQTIGARLFQIDLFVRWRKGMKDRTITLHTLRLVGMPETKGTVAPRI